MLSSRHRHCPRAGSTATALRREQRLRQSGRSDQSYSDEKGGGGDEDDDLDEEDGVHVSLRSRVDHERNVPTENGVVISSNPVRATEFRESSDTIVPLHSSNGDIGNGIGFTNTNHVGVVRTFSPFELTNRRTAPATDPYQRVRYSQLRSTLHEDVDDEEDEEETPKDEGVYERDQEEDYTIQDHEYMPACTIHATRDGEYCTREPVPPRPFHRTNRRLPASSPGLINRRS
ncbi:unnamed protein product [Echinostoma caproni]|uniref:Uncharacterized protein n=1 Tax=Echinostoma caproni TaxID=27848 RepID=A0A183A4J3_9TREM|nr:unnamed protein product [Echinostoma caproni]